MRKHLCFIACIWLVVGCSKESSKPSSQIGSPQSATHPTTQVVIKEIDLQYGIYLANLKQRTTISSAGLLRQETRGRLRPTNAKPEVHQGQLTPAQINELKLLLSDWDELLDEYGNVPDGPEIMFRYGNKTIRGGSGMPEQVKLAVDKILDFAASMPAID